MMRILRKGERYVLNKPNEKKYFLFSYIRQCMLLMAGLFSFHFVCLAQESPVTREAIGEIKPLQVGDTLPEELWHMPLQVVNHPDGKDTITLNDYRHKKLIILDFLHTLCGSCINNLPNISEMQNQMEEDLIFLVLTKQSLENLFKTMKKDILFSTKMPWCHSANSIAEYFPYRIVSHYVIIKRGKVNAITGTEGITYTKLQSLLEGIPVDFKLKYDFSSI